MAVKDARIDNNGIVVRWALIRIKFRVFAMRDYPCSSKSS